MNQFASDFAEVIRFGQGLNTCDLSPEAEEYWSNVLYPDLSKDTPGVLGAVTVRGEVQVLRLALAYALMDKSRNIEKVHLEAAAAFWAYSFESAAYIFGGETSDPVTERILEELAQGERTQTQISELFGRNQTTAMISEKLKDLEASGRCTCRKQSKGKGRPTILWSITPGFEKLSA